MHRLLRRLRSQMEAPPQSLHLPLSRLCSQMEAPPQSFHWLLRRLCSQMEVPHFDDIGFRFRQMSSVRSTSDCRGPVTHKISGKGRAGEIWQGRPTWLLSSPCVTCDLLLVGRCNVVIHRGIDQLQGDDNCHVGRPCQVSPDLPFSELL